MKQVKLFFFFLLFVSVSYYGNLSASLKSKIIASVGNEIITSFDLENKINTILFLANQPVNQENINQVKNRAIKSLINYKLKKTEIKKFNFEPDRKSIDNYLLNISRKLNVNYLDLEKKFQSNFIDYEKFYDEIETEFIWQKLIINLYYKKIKLDEAEIGSELKALVSNNQTIDEFKLSDIEIEIENYSQKNLIINEINDHITNFGFDSAALKYSISQSSNSSGNLGWVSSKVLSKDILNILLSMKPGEISNPIIKLNKIIFLKLIDKRTVNNQNNFDLEEAKNQLINKRKSELLNLYSSNHLSIVKNNTIIRFIND